MDVLTLPSRSDEDQGREPLNARISRGCPGRGACCVLEAHHIDDELRIGLFASVFIPRTATGRSRNCSARASTWGMALMHQPQPRYQKSRTTTLPDNRQGVRLAVEPCQIPVGGRLAQNLGPALRRTR